MMGLGEAIMGAEMRQREDEDAHAALLRKLAAIEAIRHEQERGDTMQSQSMKILMAAMGVPSVSPDEVRANTVAGSIVPRLLAEQ